MKKYRVNESEHFNLYSMYDHLRYVEAKMEEAEQGTYSTDEWNKLYRTLEKVQSLMSKAYCVGALVDWETLKAIREIQSERRLIRYNTCLANGENESEAAIALEL